MALRMDIETLPTMDTGIGREAGFDSDAAMIEAYETASRVDTLITPETRARIEAALERAYLTADFS